MWEESGLKTGSKMSPIFSSCDNLPKNLWNGVCTSCTICHTNVQTLIMPASKVPTGKGSGSHPHLGRESFQETWFIGEPQKQRWISEQSTIESTLPIGFRRDMIGTSRWKKWVGAAVGEPEGARDKLSEMGGKNRVWTWCAGTRIGRVGSRTGTLPDWGTRQMLLADNLMFGCYGIARQVERMGRRLPAWELTNGMSSFPIWVTVSNLSFASN